MKVIIAGSRCFTHPADYALVEMAVDASGFKITEIVSGMAKGIDTFAMRYGYRQGIKVRPFYAHWRQAGRLAGFDRNQQMADYAEALIAIWDGVSNGTRDMIEKARRKGIPVYVMDASL